MAKKETNDTSIYIESTDEITLVVEKISQSTAKDIALIASERITLLQSSINLKILKKVAKDNQVNLTIISPDPIIHNIAKTIGISVSATLDGKSVPIASEEESDLPPAINWWGKPILTQKEQEFVRETFSLEDTEQREESVVDMPQEENTPSLFELVEQNIEDAKDGEVLPLETKVHIEAIEKRKKAPLPGKDYVATIKSYIYPIFSRFQDKASISVIAGLGVLLLILVVIAIPRATITVYVSGEPFEQTFTIQATDLVVATDFTLRQIPARFIESSGSAEATVETTGEKFIGEKAKGTLVIRNKTGVEKTLPAGTIVSAKSQGKSFVLQSAVTIPKATVDGIGRVVNGSRDGVTVEAVEVGEESNIRTDDFTIGSQPFAQVWGESFKGFSGGSSQKVRVASEADITRLRQQVLGEAESKAHADLLAQQGETATIPLESISSTIVEEKYSSDPGKPAETLSLSLKISTSGIAYTKGDVDKVLLKSFQAMIPAQYKPIEEQAVHEVSLAKVDKALRTLFFEARVSTKLLPEYDQEALKAKLRFVGLGEVQDILQTAMKSTFTSPPQTSVWPFSLGRLPILTRNINITFAEQEQG